MNKSCLRRSYSGRVGVLGVGRWLAFLLQFCINRHSATNKWNWCHVRSGRVALWGRKRGLQICILQQSRWSICHPYAWGIRLPAYHLDPLLWDCDLETQWKRMGPVWAAMARLYSLGGKSDSSIPCWAWAYEGMPILSPTPALVHAMLVNDVWEEETCENVTKTLLYLRQMPWKRERLSERGERWGKNKKKQTLFLAFLKRMSLEVLNNC